MDLPQILVVGSANMDLMIRLPRMPLPGETILGGEFHMVRGGKGANQAVACARLGASTWMLGRVGRDAFGNELVHGLEADGVRCEYLVRDDTAPSGVAMILVDASGENTIAVAPGANMRVTADDVAIAVRSLDFDAVLCQLEVPIEAIAAAFQVGRERGALTILDAGPARALPPELLSLVDVLSPNRAEALAILGLEKQEEPTLEETAQRLLQTGARNVVLKLGAQGALVVSADGLAAVPAFKVDPVDTTGAGDAFTAALAVSLAEGRELITATRLAAAAGALATTVLGAAPSMPTRERLTQFLDSQGA